MRVHFLPLLAPLVWSCPARAGGFALAEGETGTVQPVEERAFVISGVTGSLEVVQLSVTGDAVHFAWILPIPGGAVGDDVQTVDSETLVELLQATDPEVSGGGGCEQNGSIYFESAYFPFYGSQNHLVVLNAIEATHPQEWLERKGYSPPDALVRSLNEEVAAGDGFAVVQMDGVPGETIWLPPVAFTARSLLPPIPFPVAESDETLETWVVVVGDEVSPIGEVLAVPGLGDEFFGDDFSAWYDARLRTVADAAPGRGWALEYEGDDDWVATPTANLLEALGVHLFPKLTDRHAVREVATRFRGWLSADERSPALEIEEQADPVTYEPTIGWEPPSDAALALPACAALGLWLRRRRQPPQRRPPPLSRNSGATA